MNHPELALLPANLVWIASSASPISERFGPASPSQREAPFPESIPKRKRLDFLHFAHERAAATILPYERGGCFPPSPRPRGLYFVL